MDDIPPSDEVSEDTRVARIHRSLCGDLEPEEFRQLEADLLTSKSLRSAFVRAVSLDSHLRENAFPGAEPSVVTQVAFAPARRWGSVFIPSLAALLMLGAFAYWWMNPRLAPESRQPLAAAVTAPAVATLADARNCRWGGSSPLIVESRIANGSLELVSGVAIIEFDAGTRLALRGPALLEILGPKTARLHRGNATVRCEHGGIYNFSLLTPTSTVIDLGTEFGVAVEATGEAEVHVLDGAVEVVDSQQTSKPTIRFLEEGRTLQLSASGGETMLADTTRQWVRDYTTAADRHADTVPPRLLARDPFPTDISQTGRFSLGTGWKSSWWQASAGPGNFSFVPAAPIAKRDGSDGLALRVGGWGEMRRVLSEPIDPNINQTVYLAFSLDRLAQQRRDKSGRLSEATVLIRSSEDPMAVLAMGLSGLNYWVVADQGGWERAERPVMSKGPFFVVAKIEFHPQRGTRISMQGYEKGAPVPSAEPETWPFVTQRQHVKIAAPLDTIALRVRTSPFKFGEISLGNSWQAVVNPASVEP